MRSALWSTGLLLLAVGFAALPFSPACAPEKKHFDTPPSQLAAFTEPAPASSAAERSYDLQQAVPLLGRPELRPALEALEADDAATALRIAQQAHLKLQPGPREAKRWHYLLAHLAEQAGDLVTAKAGYEAVTTDPWALSGYARLGAARVGIAAGDVRGALSQLQQINATGPLASAVNALFVQAALQLSDPDLAIAKAAAFLTTPPPPNWQDVALTYGRLSVERAEAKNATGSQVAPLNDAVAWLKRLRRDAVTNLEQVNDLLQRAARLLPQSEQASVLGFSAEDRLAQLDALLAQRRFEEAEAAAQQISSEFGVQNFSAQACEARAARAKALAGLRQWG
ncbi:MAG TPA: hypothetical protein VHO25_11425, partial [Polyangiaceae bacterium]|nr:hypothetical protein [Polyangiaceae bacterium]